MLFVVALFVVSFGQEESCGSAELNSFTTQDETGAYYCELTCIDPITLNSTTADIKTRSFAAIKAVCPKIQATVDLYGSASCSTTSDLVWSDTLCECPLCSCDQNSTIVDYHETAVFFTKECKECQCESYNAAGEKAWLCESTFSVSNPSDWNHLTCNKSVISCTSNDPDNNNEYSPGDVWWESSDYDELCETFCYCQYNGITYCETSYADIVSSSHLSLQYGFFQKCENAKGCQNEPDLLSSGSSSCGCPRCLCSSGKQSGDVEYVEFTEIDLSFEFTYLGPTSRGVYCMECSCEGSTTLYRNCNQYEFDSYYAGTETCPPPLKGQCLSGEDSTSLTLTDYYGTSAFGHYCGWFAQEVIHNPTGTIIDPLYNYVEMGCVGKVIFGAPLCSTFEINDGDCFHLEFMFPLYEEAHVYVMCCSGSNCNNVEINTTSCTDNSEVQEWFDTYLQCLNQEENDQYYNQVRDAITCQDLQAFATWRIGCDCEAWSTIYDRVSTTEGHKYISQILEATIADFDGWIDALDCNISLSCDLSSDTNTPSSSPTAAPTATIIEVTVSLAQTVALDSNNDSADVKIGPFVFNPKDLSSFWVLWLAIAVVILLCICCCCWCYVNRNNNKFEEYQEQNTPTGATPTGTAV